MSSLYRLKPDKPKRTYHLRGNVLVVSRVFGGEIEVSLDGRVVVPAKPAKSFGTERVSLPDGTLAEVVVLPVPLNPPDFWVRVDGRAVPDDDELADHRCQSCQASLSALDTRCGACGAAVPDPRRATIESRLSLARQTLAFLAGAAILFGLSAFVRRREFVQETLRELAGRAPDEIAIDSASVSMTVAEARSYFTTLLYGPLIAGLVLGVSLGALGVLARTRPLSAFAAAFLLTASSIAYGAYAELIEVNPFGVLCVGVVLYRGLKAAFAADAESASGR